MQIKRLHLKTQAPTELQSFYTDNLGLPITEQPEGFTVSIGKTDLTFSKATSGTDPFYHFAVNIPQNQFKAAKEWLTNRVELLQGPNGDVEISFDSINAHAIYFWDSAGNILELIARHDLDKNSSQPFTEDAFLEISEIGLPVSEVLSTAHDIETEIDVEVDVRYGGDSKPSPDFTRVGDDHGFFILVPIDRPWFPTETKAAEAHPTEVVLMGNRTAQYEFDQLPYQLSVTPSKM